MGTYAKEDKKLTLFEVGDQRQKSRQNAAKDCVVGLQNPVGNFFKNSVKLNLFDTYNIYVKNISMTFLAKADKSKYPELII